VSQTEPVTRRFTDATVMRALAHPVRIALLDLLSRSPEGVTATECATVVGLSPSATSYHLRALAKVDLIRDAPSRGDGRERVWQSIHDRLEIGHGDNPTEEDLAAESALVEAALARQNDKIRRYLAHRVDESQEWTEVTMLSDASLVATATEMRELLEQVDALMRPFRARIRTDRPDDARSVSLQLRVFPYTDTD
jgi:DNA-binding transcriptional ArsR family regulator